MSGRDSTVPLSGGAERAAQMAARVTRTAAEAGVTSQRLPMLELALDLAMNRRLETIPDEHDPLLLHPGRSALILLMDAGETRVDVLAAACLVESEMEEMRSPPARVREELGAVVATRVEAVPAADAEDLAERLVVAEEEERLIALAERLDHLRHAHLWMDGARRRHVHARAREVYLPIAERTHPTIARRYQWWCEMFSRRHLR